MAVYLQLGFKINIKMQFKSQKFQIAHKFISSIVRCFIALPTSGALKHSFLKRLQGALGYKNIM
jgi:hypothetical protein